MTLLLAALALTGCRGLGHADTAADAARETEQPRALPPDATHVARMLHQLQHSDPARSAAALQWLLTEEDANELGYFHTESIGFSVEDVSEVQAADGVWRLVHAAYLSRIADRSRGGERRARWPVAYVFDPRGRLRDWVHDYDVAILEDVNRDGDLELVAYLDSPKRVIVYAYGRGRSRELLRVDEVPEHGDLIRSVPAEHGGEYQIREKPVALIDDDDPNAPRRLNVANHGIHRWDAGQQRYVQER
jgi:hypothetical protein